MSILRRLPFLGPALAAALSSDFVGDLFTPSPQAPPRGRRPTPLRPVIEDKIRNRRARRLRAENRAGQVQAPRAGHLVQLGPYGHIDRRPITPERVNARRARCGDCWGTGVRVQLAVVRVGRQRTPVFQLQRQPTACGCVRS